jgi:hypothetical protein
VDTIKLRDYFLTKTALADNLDDVYYGLAGLKATSELVPFLDVTLSGKVHLNTQIQDMLGQ